MIVASIDIGTNTILLLIAKIQSGSNKIITVENHQRIPRIGKGLNTYSPITKDKIAELFAVLDEYANIIKKHKVEKIFVTATNPFRIASNSFEIVEEIRKRYEHEVTIVSGEEEAELAYWGVEDYLTKNKRNVVIDIGGGSTELIFGTKDNIEIKKSFPVGVVSATEKFLTSDPPSLVEIIELSHFLANSLSLLNKIPAPNKGIAVAGTPTTLACINQNLKEFYEPLIEGIWLYESEIKKMIDNLSSLTSEQILKKYKKVVEGRNDVTLAGALILIYIMQILGLDKLVVSSRGLRYGVLKKYFQQFVRGEGFEL
jgi:exopolyphosphatase/guanosine-5'-triphosphate,3'-diphosphate pyrophosphatase